MFNSNHNFFKAIIFTSRKKSEKKHETFQRKNMKHFSEKDT